MNKRGGRGDVLLVAALLAAMWILTGCAGGLTGRVPDAAEAETAYPVNAPVDATATATEIPAIDTPAPEPTVPLNTPSSEAEGNPEAPAVDVVPAVDEAVTGILPKIVARTRLVESPEILRDLRFDGQSNRLFITTSDDQLLVLDAVTFAEQARFAFGGDLTLDELNRWLYAAPDTGYVPAEETPVIHVIDADSLEEVGAIEGRRSIALDPSGERLFAGSPIGPYEDETNLPGVGIYDLATLEPIGQIELSGVPTYNALRNELLITAYTVLVVDPDSGVILEDLIPNLKEQPFAWCNGCEHAARATVFEGDGLLVIERSKVSTGAGPGSEPEPLYFDASTLEPIQAFDRLLPMQFMCGSQPLLLPPISERIYRQSVFIRYMVYRNFSVHSLRGETVTWRDGLFAPYVNPHTGQAYTTQGYVLDLESLMPVGRIPVFCPLAVDEEKGRIYGRVEGDLLVIDERGGAPASPLPTEPRPEGSRLPAAGLREILVSPGYPDDPTVFVLLDSGRVYRTEDDGHTWTRLQGGLPAHDYLTLTIKLSPNFAEDRTLFAGGFVGDYQGEGVLRSIDAGDTWEPMWRDLSLLRVYDLAISPDYKTDGRVQAHSRYRRLSPWESGVGLFESSDRGLSWSLVMTDSDESALYEQMAIASPPEPELPVRLVDYGQAVEVKSEGSENWAPMDLGQQDTEVFRTVQPSPSYATDGTLYVLGEYGLWRTTDRGATWARWDDPRLRNRNYENALSALAVSPALPDGSHKLFVGSFAGEFWVLTPAEGASGGQVPGPTITATPPPIEANPDEPTPQPLPEELPPGAYRPVGPLATLWEASDQTQSDLGFAVQETAASVPAAYQSFEHGAMIWRKDTLSILVLFDDGGWQTYSDTFKEGEPESDPALVAPAGMQQPMRGFGKLWRAELEIQERLGWALDKEQGYSAFIQEFERGFLLGSPVGARVFVRVSEEEGRWR